MSTNSCISCEQEFDDQDMQGEMGSNLRVEPVKQGQRECKQCYSVRRYSFASEERTYPNDRIVSSEHLAVQLSGQQLTS
jgi:hypothetical protein